MIPLIINDLNGGKIITIKININNNKSLFLLDTGSSYSVIDNRKIDKFTSIIPNKSKFNISSISDVVETYNIKINIINIGNLKILNEELQVVDLLHLNNMFSTNYLNVIDGIIGNDIIFKYFSFIDIENKIIKEKEN